MPVIIDSSEIQEEPTQPDSSETQKPESPQPYNAQFATDDKLNIGQIAPLYGVYPAIVTDNVDPDNQGRIRVSLPWMASDSGEIEIRARLTTLMAGNERGTFFLPEVNDEVLIAFEAGNPQRAYIVGALWNGQDKPPLLNDGENNQRQICSRNGIKITFDDKDGAEQLICETPQGRRMVLTDEASGSILIEDNAGNSVTMRQGEITISAASTVKVNGSAVELNASMVSVDASMARFKGVVQCETLISNAVISASYTPGAGNIL